MDTERELEQAHEQAKPPSLIEAPALDEQDVLREEPLTPQEAQDWTGERARRWLAHIASYEAMLLPVNKALFDAADLKQGERVVDVGCGAGPATLEIARRVSPGLAVGVDISPVLLDQANERIVKPGALPKTANVRFVLGDAASTTLQDAPFDVLFSRFGVMFFEDPYRAFTNMRSWLKPTGRAAFACWAPERGNPWMLDVHNIIRRFVEIPDFELNAPGPFGLADIARLNDILAWSDFTDVEVRTWRGELPIGGAGSNPIRAAEFALSAMHFGVLISGAPDNVKASIRREIEQMFTARPGPNGVSMPGTAWIVTARAG